MLIKIKRPDSISYLETDLLLVESETNTVTLSRSDGKLEEFTQEEINMTVSILSTELEEHLVWSTEQDYPGKNYDI